MPPQALAVSLEVLITVPLRALLDQFALDFPGFCKVGMGHNQKINFDAKGFIAVTKSVHLLTSLELDAIFVDEAHHPLPPGMPKYKQLYRFSATHTDEPDFRYTMGRAIDDGVLCDYDITVPAVTEHHAYVCLADLLLKQAGRFRRVLAYCNTVREAKKFQMVVEELGLAAWHINAGTSQKRRLAAIEEFGGDLTKPVHVLVTVEVLGEGINILNADTCMFVEPRNSYRSVIQAIGRVLRHHPGKTLAHIVLPAVAVPAKVDAGEEYLDAPKDPRYPGVSRVGNVQRHPRQLEDASTAESLVEETPTVAEKQQREHPSTEFTATTRGEVNQRPNPSIQKSFPFALAPTSNGQDKGVSGTATEERLEESAGIGRVSPTESEQSERPAEKAQLGSERSTAAADKVNTSKVVWNEHGSSSELRSLQGRPVLQAPGKSLQTTPHTSSVTSAHLQAILGQQELPLVDEGDNNILEVNRNTLHATDTHRNTVVSQGVKVPFSFADQHSSGEASADHAQANSLKRAPVASTDAVEGVEHWTHWGSDTQAGTGSTAGTQWMVDQHKGAQELRREHRNRGGQLTSSAVLSGGDEFFSTQLERFLSLLVQADSRLVGSSMGYRIQLVDCRLAADGELVGWADAVCGRLTAILQQSDPWEQRLQSVEDFAAINGRLPMKHVGERNERTLGYWLSNHGLRPVWGQLEGCRVQRLLNSSSLLVRRRAEGWLLKDPNCAFKRRCQQLKQYVEMYGKLPSNTPNSSYADLASWLTRQKATGAMSNPHRRPMLESVHPLVAKLVEKWDANPARVDASNWQGWLERLVSFARARGRLPLSYTIKSERPMYLWLNRQVRRLEHLPEELVQQLRTSHPLITAAVNARKARKVRLNGFAQSGARCYISITLYNRPYPSSPQTHLLLFGHDNWLTTSLA